LNIFFFFFFDSFCSVSISLFLDREDVAAICSLPRPLPPPLAPPPRSAPLFVCLVCELVVTKKRIQCNRIFLLPFHFFILFLFPFLFLSLSLSLILSFFLSFYFSRFIYGFVSITIVQQPYIFYFPYLSLICFITSLPRTFLLPSPSLLLPPSPAPSNAILNLAPKHEEKFKENEGIKKKNKQKNK